MSHTPLIIGNWKLNPNTSAEAIALSAAIAKKHKQENVPLIALAPSFIHLAAVAPKLTKSSVALAAQDVSLHGPGAQTGEVSAAQLKDAGVTYVIVGHSERRAMGESDETVVAKVLMALKHKLTPVVCVGEHERDEQGNFFSYVEAQIVALAEALTPAQMKKLALAYEPIWAIGTGNTATVEDVKEMQLFIESVLTKRFDRATARKVRVLYGGSVKPHNAAELQADGGMNGFLVGGASLKAEDFITIIEHTKYHA